MSIVHRLRLVLCGTVLLLATHAATAQVHYQYMVMTMLERGKPSIQFAPAYKGVTEKPLASLSLTTPSSSVISNSEVLVQTLNELDADGWEIAHTELINSDYLIVRYILRKPK